MFRIMKIGIESQRIFRSHKHGMDVVAVELIRQIQQLDTENEFLLFAKEGSDNRCVIETDNFSIKKLKGLTYGDWEQLSLPRALKKYKPALIHCTANTAPLYCPVPLVLTLHDIIFLRETSFRGTAYQNFGNIYRRLVVPPAMKKARMIITVSEEEKKIITEVCRVDPSRITVVHNAVHDRFRVNHKTEELELFRRSLHLPANFILHLGNTAPKKNTPRFIEAYVRYAGEKIDALPLVIADYPLHLLREQLGRLNARHLENKIHLPGYIPSASMPMLYCCATLFVYPSLLESFGLPVLEAMASGTPVITSHVPALREVAGDAAEYIDPESVSSISHAILNILADDHRKNTLQTLGLQRSAAFNWRTSAQKLLEVYQSII